MGAKDKAIFDLDSRLFVIPEIWHRKRILKCHIRFETYPEELTPISLAHFQYSRFVYDIKMHITIYPKYVKLKLKP